MNSEQIVFWICRQRNLCSRLYSTTINLHRHRQINKYCGASVGRQIAISGPTLKVTSRSFFFLLNTIHGKHQGRSRDVFRMRRLKRPKGQRLLRGPYTSRMNKEQPAKRPAPSLSLCLRRRVNKEKVIRGPMIQYGRKRTYTVISANKVRPPRRRSHAGASAGHVGYKSYKYRL